MAFKIRTDEGFWVELDWDPKAYKTQAGAAKSLFKELTALAVSMGQAKSEVRIWEPKDKPHGEAQWVVSWEAGPYQWAVGASCSIEGPWGYTEPHYSFDLCFTD